jgi:hypothetical protein
MLFLRYRRGKCPSSILRDKKKVFALSRTSNYNKNQKETIGYGGMRAGHSLPNPEKSI